MVNVSHNASLSSHEHEFCQYNIVVTAILVLTDVLTFLVGQSPVPKLLWIIFTSRRPTDILNINLAVFHNFLYLLSVCHLVMLFVLEDFHLEFLNILLVYTQVGGPMSLCFICLERYVAVIHPTSYPLLKTYRMRELFSATVWIMSFSTTMVSLPFKGLSSFVKSWLKTIPVFVMVIMMDTMLFCTIFISRALKKSGPGQDKLHPVKRRAFITVCTTTAVTMFLYTPVTLLQRFNIEVGFPFYCLFRAINMVLLSAASVVHPVLYLHTRGQLFSCSRRPRKGR